MSQTLLGKMEAKRTLRLNSFPECSLADIFGMEEELFRSYSFLGTTLRDALIADLENYSAVSEYDSTLTYALDANTNYKGVIYVSLASSNDAVPTDSTKWSVADKFQTACFNTLWCDYGLGEFLSRMLLLDSMAEAMVKLTGNGLVVERSADFIIADSDHRTIYINSQKDKANRALIRVRRHINDNDGTGECFDGLIVADSEECIYENGKFVGVKPTNELQNDTPWNIY